MLEVLSFTTECNAKSLENKTNYSQTGISNNSAVEPPGVTFKIFFLKSLKFVAGF